MALNYIKEGDTLTTLFQQLINGLSLGSIYALLALGYTMVYGIIKLINFAHGDIYMLGAFWGYYTINFWHFNFIFALLSAMVVCAAAGVVIEYFAYRPLRHAPRITALITAIGVSYFLENGMSYLYGADTRDFPQVIKQVNFNFWGVRVSNIQILILATAGLLMILLQLIIKKTKMGRAMRAVSVDPDAAELVGININRTISFTFALGSSMAGAAGGSDRAVLQLHRSFDGYDTRYQSLCCRRCRWYRIGSRSFSGWFLDWSAGNGGAVCWPFSL